MTERAWRYHPEFPARIFEGEEILAAENEGWVDSLSKVPGTPEYIKVNGEDKELAAVKEKADEAVAEKKAKAKKKDESE